MSTLGFEEMDEVGGSVIKPISSRSGVVRGRTARPKAVKRTAGESVAGPKKRAAKYQAAFDFSDEELLRQPHRAPRPNFWYVASWKTAGFMLLLLVTWAFATLFGQVSAEVYRRQAIQSKVRTRAAERAAKALAARVEEANREDRLAKWAIRNGFIKDSVAADAVQLPNFSPLPSKRDEKLARSEAYPKFVASLQ